MRNVVYVILAIGGYFVAPRLSLGLGLLFVYFPYLPWLPFAGFIYWRLAPLIGRRVPRSLLFAALISPAITVIYGVGWLQPLAASLYSIVSGAMAEPGSLSLEQLGRLLPFVLGPFLFIWVVAYWALLSSPCRRRGAPEARVKPDPLSALVSESKKDRGLIVGLTGLLVIAGAFALHTWDQHRQEIEELEDYRALATAMSRALSTADANLSAVIGQAATLRAEVAMQLTPALRNVTPPSSAVAQSFSSAGTGPITIAAGSSLLLRFQPTRLGGPIETARSLTLYISTADMARSGLSPLDFVVWDFQGAWAFEEIEKRVPWGDTSIDIRPPDSYVNKSGEIYLELRNYRGTEPVDLADVNFT
ncbi:MAG: hypothetical protein ACRDHG_14595, partial [Anaerolineales bacterium]